MTWNISCKERSVHGAVGVDMCAALNSFVFQIVVCSMEFVGKKAADDVEISRAPGGR